MVALPRTRVATVDIAGTAWPIFKLEAIAIGLAVALIAGFLLGSTEIAVLAAAAATTLVWLLGALRARRD